MIQAMVDATSVKVDVVGASISALWFEAKTPSPHTLKAAILVHGFASDKTESGLFIPTASRLSSMGISTLTYDWRGRGNSTGDFAHTSLEVHISDFTGLCQWICDRLEVELNSILAVGFSLGAVVALRHIASHGPLGGVACLSPAFRPALDMWPRYNLPELFSTIKASGVATKPGSEDGALIGQEVLDFLRDTDLGEDALVGLRLPLLVCHGTSDTRIPYVTSEKVVSRALAADCQVQFKLFDGATHSFRPAETFHPMVIDALCSWIDAVFPTSS